MTQITEEKRWTYEDYLHLIDDKRYEILGGKLSMMTPAPEFNHQLISARLQFLIMQFVESKGLGYVVDAPTDVVLDEENVVQPDILFVSRENKDVIGKKGVFGPPDLVVEIGFPIYSALQEFDTQTLEAEALWGQEIRTKTDELCALVRKLNAAIEAYIRNEAAGGTHFESDKDFDKKIQSEVFASPQAQDNALSNAIQSAVSSIEIELKPHLKRG